MNSSYLRALGDEPYVALTTYRRDGTPVTTPVWIASGGADSLVVFTMPDTGKVKRLRRDPRVELQPCTRFGAVAPGAPLVRARAEIVSGGETAWYIDLLRRKYGVQYRVVRAIERRVMREDEAGADGSTRSRVVLRITVD